MLIWRISGSLRLSQNFVKNCKFSWQRSLAKFQILTNICSLSFLTYEWICKSQNGILECSYINFNDFWKFQVKSKFCRKLEILMSAVLSEISDFDQIFITLISNLWVNFKSQNSIPESSDVDLKDFWKFEVESKFCQNWKFSWPRSLAKFQILNKFSSLSFLTCEWVPSLKMAF